MRARDILLSPRSLVRPDALAIVLSLAVLGVVCWSFADYGISYDETLQDQYGQYVLQWFVTLTRDRSAVTYDDLFYYGGLFDLVAAALQRISPFGHYETRHLLNGLVGVFGLLGCWRLARYVGGPGKAGPVVGLLSIVLLLTMPSWYGMMYINPKDIPFAAGMTWSLYYLVRVADRLPEPPIRLVLRLGLATGLALAARVGGILAFGYLGVVLAAHVLTSASVPWQGRLDLAIRLFARVFLPTVAIAWLVMLAAWPYAQVDPLGNPLLSIAHFAGYRPGIEALFFGRLLDDQYQPLLYLPVYLLIKVPEAHVLLLAAAAVMSVVAVRQLRAFAVRERWFPVAVAIVVPLLYICIGRPELYDAERHFLFLLPPIAVAAALALRALFVRAGVSGRAALVVGVVLSCALAVHEMIDLHPYQYAYFNQFVGGIRGARGRFETEYWDTAITEAARLLRLQLAAEASGAPARVIVSGVPEMAEEPLEGSASVTDESTTGADFLIVATSRYGKDDVPGRTVGVVERDGVVFAVIKDLRDVARLSTEPHS